MPHPLLASPSAFSQMPVASPQEAMQPPLPMQNAGLKQSAPAHTVAEFKPKVTIWMMLQA